MSAWFSSQQMADAIERAIRETRAQVVEEERARVSRAIFLYGNTTADERCAEAILALLPHLYDTAERAEPNHVAH